MREGHRVLILGGTGEAAELAERLAAIPNVSVLSSLAGRVSHPHLPVGHVRIGGFGGVDGMISTLRDEQIHLVIDATHPYASTISAHAATACARSGVPMLILERPAWLLQDGDRWYTVETLKEAAAKALTLGSRIFVTTGRRTAPSFTDPEAWYLFRSIDPPEEPLRENCEWILDRGPFTHLNELALMRRYAIDVVVSKNSGGDATYAKIVAARQLGIPVVMLERPICVPGEKVFSIYEAYEWVIGRF